MNNTATTALSVRDPWSLVPPVGNLDAYIAAVNRIPLLTPQEEVSYAERLQSNGDVEAAGRLVLSHLRLVVSVSRQYLGYGLPQGDLIQEGNVGLMKAVRRFDPTQGVRLVSYALHWIKAEIHEYILRNWRMVKVATTKAQRKLFFNLRSMKQRPEERRAGCRHPPHQLLAGRDRRRRARAERQARRSAGDGNPPVRRRRGAGGAKRRRRGSLRADRLPGRRHARADARDRGAPPRLAGRRRHQPGIGRAGRAQPAHRRGALAEGQRRFERRHDAARAGRRIRRQRRAHPPDRGGRAEEDAQGAANRRPERSGAPAAAPRRDQPGFSSSSSFRSWRSASAPLP